MSELVSIDGRIVSAAEASVSVFDRGFLYGDSVFETLRTYGGVPFAFGGDQLHAAHSSACAARSGST